MTLTKNVWKAAALLLILALISAVMISGTYAKYTSTFAGEDTALVAKWKVIGTGGGISLTEGGTADLDLFSHAYDNNLIASEGGVYILAPGVGDKFVLSFTNESDVDVEITFDIAATGTAINLPIEFSLDDFDTDPLTLNELNTELADTFADIPADPDGSDPATTATVSWRWAFDGDNAVDTGFGTASAGVERSTYGLTINATASQKTPSDK